MPSHRVEIKPDGRETPSSEEEKYNMATRRLFPLLVALLLGALAWPASAAPTKLPNIVVLLADDLGYGDLGCFGSKVIKTPNLDKLAAEGMRLTQCYAGAPVCSPSRAALLTGRVPGRAGVWDWIPLNSAMHVGRGEVTVGKVLKAAGYATCHVGKWHCNGKFNTGEQPQPGDHGFDHWFSTQNNAVPSHDSPNNFVRNGKPVGPIKGYSSAIIVDEAVRWLDGIKADTAKRDKPFCLFVWFHSPHEPIATGPEFTKLYADRSPKEAAYYGNVTQLDHEVGRLLKRLDALGASDDTLVFFSSDNGPMNKNPGSAGPFRGAKASLYEGGIREPTILRWPGKTRPGTVYEEPVAFVDWLPTVCALTGAPVPTDWPIDGASFLPLFDGKPVERKGPLFWHYLRRAAMRDGDWKIIGSPQEGELQLFNIRQDPHEKNDLAAQEPERMKALSERFRALYSEILKEGGPITLANQGRAGNQNRENRNDRKP
jgi:arylsulfatase A